MKLQVALALVCVLFPKALALKCYECVPELFGQCTDTKTDCPDQCDSITMVTKFGDIQHERHSKGCAVAEQCDTVSLNVGMMKVAVNSKCCSTDLCNSGNVPALPKGSPNGKMCYACADQDCSDTVNCEGDEDRCISATGKEENT
ncbi:hypothetical protein NFI96_021041 [Prochilodus magdalenae]|nr:hypothetical protein NFI96_021041 [Prochilodus magdalenae]